jgi:hypothetical protein
MNTLHEMALSLSSPRVSGALLESAGKSFVILGAALPLALWCRRSAAATRHFIWLAALAGLLVLPLASAWTPHWSRPAWVGKVLGAQAARADGIRVSRESSRRLDATQVRGRGRGSIRRDAAFGVAGHGGG